MASTSLVLEGLPMGHASIELAPCGPAQARLMSGLLPSST
ncbi:uncharacterized protein RCO7_14285 [Rhynchosporium graminicola]|uniref:Uncharacterized protein n=1 Tax=Rhynchosporium graminicola TaxID=2792576 RepID=A0A1E1K638_9HELO|nr:uncharacterized protein RCO7_14285 [Rhynchosporium commune]